MAGGWTRLAGQVFAIALAVGWAEVIGFDQATAQSSTQRPAQRSAKPSAQSPAPLSAQSSPQPSEQAARIIAALSDTTACWTREVRFLANTNWWFDDPLNPIYKGEKLKYLTHGDKGMYVDESVPGATYIVSGVTVRYRRISCPYE